jgi:hypothetical protein
LERFRHRYSARDDLGHADRSWVNDAVGLDARPRRVCVPVAQWQHKPDADANRHCYCHSNRNCYSHSNGDVYSDGDSYLYANGHSHVYSYGNGDINSNRYCDCNCNCNVDSNGNSYSNTNTHSDSDAYCLPTWAGVLEKSFQCLASE